MFAVGNPLGLERTVTQGIVSNRSRDIEGQIFLQTDAAINPGNSGGPLFNQRGEVIGVTSRGAHAAMADNLGFAIPVTYVKQFLHHREAFSFDKANPNSGYRYSDPPRRLVAGRPEGLKARPGDAKPPSAKPGGDKARQAAAERGLSMSGRDGPRPRQDRRIPDRDAGRSPPAKDPGAEPEVHSWTPARESVANHCPLGR